MAIQLPFRFSGLSASKPTDSRARQSKMMEYDQPLAWVALLLMLLGMVMVYSASISLPDSPKFASYKNSHFLTRQATFIVVSLLAGLLAFRIRIADWQRAAPYLFSATLALLVLVLVPGIGVEVNGGRRWLSLKAFNLQPSELMKVVAVLYAADYTVRKQEYMHKLTKGFMPMAGALRAVFGVCANGWSPSDGQVVSLDHGCGAHSETDVPADDAAAHGRPIVDEFAVDILT